MGARCAGLSAILVFLLVGSARGQTPLSNTMATEATIWALASSVPPESLKIYLCHEGVFDDLGNQDAWWGEPPSPGRITSAAWGIGCGRYLYAYQLSNPNFLGAGTTYNGYWDVALFGRMMGGFRIPLGPHQVAAVDFDGNGSNDTSFRTSDHACHATVAEYPPNDCAPFANMFSRFTADVSECGLSWSDYYAVYPGEVSYDAIVSAQVVDEGGAGLFAEFFVQSPDIGSARGIVYSTQVFGFVANAPPTVVTGQFLGGASANIDIVAPGTCALTIGHISMHNSAWRDSSYAASPTQKIGGPGGQGCMITALSMLINHRAEAEGDSWTALPLDMNAQLRWGGYVPGVGLDPKAAVEYAHDNNVSTFEYHGGVGTREDARVDRYLCAGFPVALGVKPKTRLKVVNGVPKTITYPGHWVVAKRPARTGTGARTYVIDDPDQPTNETLLSAAPYNNVYIAARYYGAGPRYRKLCLPGESQTGMVDDGGLLLASDADGVILVTDALGRRSGINPASGEEFGEIPFGRSYFDGVEAPDGTETPLAAVFEDLGASTGLYRVEVGAAPAGAYYNLQVNGTDSEGAVQTVNARGWIAAGTVETWAASYEEGTGAVVVPPAGVGNLTVDIVGSTEVWLIWAAPGEGGSVRVEYDLRYARFPITESNFESATEVLDEPSPAAIGAWQGATIVGLSPETQYWLAMRTRDVAGKWSPISNVVQVETMWGGWGWGGGGGGFAAKEVGARQSSMSSVQSDDVALDVGGGAVGVEMTVEGWLPVWSIYRLDATSAGALAADDSATIIRQFRGGGGAEWGTHQRLRPGAGNEYLGVRRLNGPGRVVLLGDAAALDVSEHAAFQDERGTVKVTVSKARHSRFGDVTASVLDGDGLQSNLELGDTLTLSYELTTDRNATSSGEFFAVGVRQEREATSSLRRRAPGGIEIPRSFALRQNLPNPFDRTTSVRFDLPVEATVRLEIFDAQGRLVRTLADGQFPAGSHALEWDVSAEGGRSVGAGVYLYRIQAGAFHDQKKMVLLAR